MENNEKYSTFSIFKIGPVLADLISYYEQEQYEFKIVSYNALIWDWYERDIEYLGEVKESCYVIAKPEVVGYKDNICLSQKRRIYKDKSVMCLGVSNYDSINHQNIVDGIINFYTDNCRTIIGPFDDLIYEFIDQVILYRININEDPTIEELNGILERFRNNKTALKRSIN